MGSEKSKLQRILILIILASFSIFALAPFFFMLVASFKPGRELLRNGINAHLQFNIMNFNNYITLFTANDGMYIQWYKNSLLITIMFTVISLFLSSMVGYGLAVYNFRGKKVLFTIVLIVMMIPIEILILPLYKLVTFFNIIDTYWGVILPFAVAPSAIFFFRQYVLGVPKDFIEAARIDGCGEFGIFFRIMVPLMKPAFGAMTILQAMASWNSFVWPLIVLRSTENLTLPVGLASLITPYGNNYDMLMPGAVISILPIAILFLLNQKSFISGLTVGGVKG
jgi:ABC-type sugar transport system, permease component